MKMNFKKGFTLIELLVVVAIIGVLASVVLASLNTARAKGTDAAIKSNLDNTRAQASLYYDTNSGYSSAAVAATATGGTNLACSIANSIFDPAAPNSINGMIVAAQQAYGGASAARCTITVGTVAIPSTNWAADVPLKNPVTTGDVWCVDSTGVSKEEAVPAFTTAVSTC
jgi:prepilin-type N-terminal cleavage/methylation domain-containing protein